MTKEEFVIKACMHALTNARLIHTNRYDHLPLSAMKIVDAAEKVSDELLTRGYFDTANKLDMKYDFNIVEENIALSLADIEERASEMRDKVQEWGEQILEAIKDK